MHINWIRVHESTNAMRVSRDTFIYAKLFEVNSNLRMVESGSQYKRRRFVKSTKEGDSKWTL